MAVDWVTDFIRGTDGHRTLAIVSNATPSFNADVQSAINISAQAAAMTSLTFTGEPVDLQEFIFRIKDNGVARALTFGSQFEAVGAALPTITVAGKRHTLRFLYDAAAAKFGLVYAAVEA